MKQVFDFPVGKTGNLYADEEDNQAGNDFQAIGDDKVKNLLGVDVHQTIRFSLFMKSWPVAVFSSASDNSYGL